VKGGLSDSDRVKYVELDRLFAITSICFAGLGGSGLLFCALLKRALAFKHQRFAPTWCLLFGNPLAIMVFVWGECHEIVMHGVWS
jgi:hypothetical protein